MVSESVAADHEVLLRQHIRNLLSDYILQHIAIDHVRYLQDTTAELLNDTLNLIPVYDTTSLVLPVEPLEALKMKLKLGELPSYDEVWEAPPEAMHLIRSSIVICLREDSRIRSTRVWDDDYDEKYTYCANWPMDTVLARSSLKLTPRLGSKKPSSRLAGANTILELFLESKNVKGVKEEDFHLPNTERLEELMDVKLSLEGTMQNDILALHRSTPFTTRMAPQRLARAHETCSAHIPNFLRSETPPYEEKLQKMSPPLFVRQRRVATRKVGKGDANGKENRIGPIQIFGSIEEILKPVEVPKIDPDMAEANMALISGWTVLQTSPSSSRGTPSLSSDGSEVDELDEEIWMPSSPSNLPARIKLLQDAKLDEPLFPRSGRPQCATALVKKKTESLSSFISSRLPSNPSVRIANPTSDDSTINRHLRPSSPPISISMIGQPPSDLSSEAHVESAPTETETQTMVAESDRLSKDIKRLCKSVETERAPDFIMRERLDEKATMFMDVPYLPPPNAYLRGERFGGKDSRTLQCVKDLVSERASSSVPLKKVTGLKSLNLDLSWRPFTYGRRIPTNEELVGVEEPLSFPADEQRHDLHFDTLVAEATLSPNAIGQGLISVSDNTFHQNLSQDYDNADYRRPNDDDHLILTRSERLAAIGQLEPEKDTENIADLPDSFDVVANPAYSIPEAFSVAYTNVKDQEGYYDEDNDVMREWKRRRLLPADTNFAGKTDEWEGYDGHNNGMAVDPKELVLCDPLAQDALFGDGPSVVIDTGADARLETNESAVQCTLAFSGDAGALPDIGNEPKILAPADQDKIMDCQTAHLSNETIRERPINRSVAHDSNSETRLHLPSAITEKLSLTSFLQMRGKKFAGSPDDVFSSPPHRPSSAVVEPQELAEHARAEPIRQSVPQELIAETKAFPLPEMWDEPQTQQTYLVSLDLIQKRSLVRILESSLCAVRLVERDYLTSLGIGLIGAANNGTALETPVEVSIIPSPHCAIIFFPLAAVPSQAKYQTLLASLSAHSFSSSRILLILEAYPRAHLFRAALAETADFRYLPYAYSPPAVKAVKRIQRDLAVREGLGEKSATCKVDLAFADTVEECAIHVRNFGQISLRGSIVDFGPYIGEEEQEGERDLASMQGMNAFCAAVILRCCNVDSFLKMSPEERVAGYAALIGQGRIDLLNFVLGARLEAMDDLPASSDYLSSTSS